MFFIKQEISQNGITIEKLIPGHSSSHLQLAQDQIGTLTPAEMAN
jgi:hypothetical protein